MTQHSDDESLYGDDDASSDEDGDESMDDDNEEVTDDDADCWPLGTWLPCKTDRSITANFQFRKSIRAAAGLSAAGIPDGRHKCEQCDRSYAHPSGLSAHIQYQHGVGKTFVCTLCPGKAWVTYQPLKAHEQKVHGSVLTAPPKRGPTFKPGHGRRKGAAAPCYGHTSDKE